MGISRIGILFAANVDSLKKSQQHRDSDKAGARDAAEAHRNDDAAVVSHSSSYATNPAHDPDRVARVQQLKNQVRRGQYNITAAKVALSLYRDLL
jgi:anti-sigma28 factor (negative regulator of flagellin synthesis)